MGSNSYEKPDFWSRKAFSEGYPARSVYKLKEIDEKFGMIRKSSTVLDLGSAPGSWTTFLLRKMTDAGKVVSVDLNPLDLNVKGDNLIFIRGDLNDSDIRTRIQKLGPYDLVVCDAAPLTTGNRTVDTAKSGGNFVVKIFQNGDQQTFIKAMREFFSTARGFKPQACRSESFETYLLGINKK